MGFPSLLDYQLGIEPQPVPQSTLEGCNRLASIKCIVASLFKNAERPWTTCIVVEDMRSPAGDLIVKQGEQIWEVLVT